MRYWQHMRACGLWIWYCVTLGGIYKLSYRIGPINIVPGVLGVFFTAVSAGLVDAGDRYTTQSNTGTEEALRSSVNQLQTFDSDAQKQRDAQRDQQIRETMPNFRIIREGHSDGDYREHAVNRLKRMRLSRSGKEVTNHVLDDMSIYRHLPEIRFESDDETYDYFISHPDVVVSMWQAMGISAIDLQQAGQYQYQMNNIDGTKCQCSFLKRSKNINIIYCKGEFQSPLLRNPIQAEGVLCLFSKFETQRDGTPFVRHSADVFVSFPNAAISTAARLISPVSNYIADRNFQEISLFLHSMSLTMSRQPSFVQNLATELKGITPEKAEELNQITLKTYHSNQDRMAARWDELETPVQLK